MPNKLDQQLDQLISELYKSYISNYTGMLEKARNKQFAYQKALENLEKEKEDITEKQGAKIVLSILDEHFQLGDPFIEAIEKLKAQFEQHDFQEAIQGTIKEFPMAQFTSHPAYQKVFELYQNNLVMEAEEKGQQFTAAEYWKLRTDSFYVDYFARYKAIEQFKNYLDTNTPYLDGDLIGSPEHSIRNKEHTTARQVAAIHYIFKALEVYTDTLRPKGEFIHFLTGKSIDNINKRLSHPFNLSEEVFKKDMRYIREYFKQLGLFRIVEMINKDIDN